MKFRAALAVSSILHLSIFAYMLISPGRRDSGEMTYYVDLIHLSGPGGGGRGSGPAGGRSGAATREAGNSGEEPGQTTLVSETGRLRDLSARQDPPPSNLRYPDEQGRKQTEKKDAVSVIRKPQTEKSEVQADRTNSDGSLTTGISTGTGSGTGGVGPGGGGAGGGWSFSHFPYAYYVETLRNRISASWYNSLVEPGGRGRFLTSVYFRIQRDGSITELKVEKKSGLATLDLSALRAVESAAPFPPLPADFRSAYLGVYFEFEWER